MRGGSVGAVDGERLERVVGLFVNRDQLETIEGGCAAAVVCLARAGDRLTAARVLEQAGLWESAYTAAYDAYRTAADAVVLSLGYRVPATAGAHRITFDIVQAKLGEVTDVFGAAPSTRIRQGRHESEYFDPERPVDKSAEDVAWALGLAARAIEAVGVCLKAG